MMKVWFTTKAKKDIHKNAFRAFAKKKYRIEMHYTRST